MSDAHEAQMLARRRELLELEAGLQRATLAATFKQWEEKRSLTWLTAGGRLALKLLATPRVRWLVLAAVLRRLRRKRKP